MKPFKKFFSINFYGSLIRCMTENAIFKRLELKRKMELLGVMSYITLQI